VRKLVSISVGAVLALAVGAGSVLAGGPPAVGFYVDGTLYRTIGTPTDFSNTGAPAHSYDTIYALGDGFRNVAEAAPGDSGFNGGRWMVVPIIWTNIAPTQFTRDEQILAAEAAGDIDLGAPVKYFECPVIKVQPNH
jgi:hypothetical protein